MIETVGYSAIPLAGWFGPIKLMLVIAGQALTRLGLVVFRISQVSIRQAVTLDRLMVRVHATRRLVLGVIPISALLGGFLGETIGWQFTLWSAAGIMFLAFGYPLRSRIRFSLQHAKRSQSQT